MALAIMAIMAPTLLPSRTSGEGPQQPPEGHETTWLLSRGSDGLKEHRTYEASMAEAWVIHEREKEILMSFNKLFRHAARKVGSRP